MRTWIMQIEDWQPRPYIMPGALTGAGERPVTLCTEIPIAGWVDQHIELDIQGLFGTGSLEVDGQLRATFDSTADGRLRADITPLCTPGLDTLPMCLRFEAGTGARGVQVGVWLHGYTLLEITSLNISSNEDGSSFTAQCAVEAEQAGRYLFSYAVALGNEPIGTLNFEEDLDTGPHTCAHRLAIAGARIWQPGQRNRLYSIKLTVLKQGVGCDVARQRMGMLPISQAQPLADYPACLAALDGQRVFLQGTVWDIPAGHPLSHELLRSRIDALEAAHVQCLYVPDPQSEAFYEACDRRGMMVWQALPATPARADTLARRLIHHTCVVQWGMRASANPASQQDIADILAALDDKRPFVGSTPQRDGSIPVWEDLGRGKCFNVAGPQALLDPERMARYANADDALLRVLHGMAPGYTAHNSVDWFGLDAAWGKKPPAALTEYLCAETLRYFAERARFRGAVGFFGGSVTTPGGAAPGALIDGDGALCAAYYALQCAYAPVAACALLNHTACWAGSVFPIAVQLLVTPPTDWDAPPLPPVRVHASLYRGNGELCAQRAWDDVPCHSAELGTLDVTAPASEDVLLLRLRTTRDNPDDPEAPTLLHQSDVTLAVGVRGLQAIFARRPLATLVLRGGRLTNVSSTLAFGVMCDDALNSAVGGWGALLPGESWEVRGNANARALGASVYKPR
ncbi:MAG: hypothetical protein LBU67_05155 [Oscillospiraceae bacterium]|nr:hypothetical protein [Oscillospiraceae bacterium]